MKEWLSRTALLLGEESISRFSARHVLIVGLGGVGAYAAEMICRAGIGEMTIIDGDIVSLSNINRQLPATHSSVGEKKAGVLERRFKDINPEIRLNVITDFLDEDAMKNLLENNRYDFIVDAIDTLAPKIALISNAIFKDMPIISAMGAGGKTDPSQIRITDISKTYECPLAKVVRKRLKEMGIYKGLTVVFSPEKVNREAIISTNERNKRSTVGTVSYLPAMFGCYMASHVIRNL